MRRLFYNLKTTLKFSLSQSCSNVIDEVFLHLVPCKYSNYSETNAVAKLKAPYDRYVKPVSYTHLTLPTNREV